MAISLYKVAKFFMIPTGLWKAPISKNPYILKIYFIYSLIIQFNYVLYNISLIKRLTDLLLLGETPIEMLYTDITLAILILEINFKVMIYLKNKVPEMFFTVMEREEQILMLIKTENNPKQQTNPIIIYLEQVRYYKLATFCQCFCSGFAILLFAVSNLYVKLVQGMLPDQNFMYELWFPFDKEKYDLVVTMYNIFIALCGFFFNCATQTALQTLIVFCTSQLRILQLNLKKCFLQDCCNNAEEHLKELIKEHQFLIEFTTNLNDAIKYVILFEFALEAINGAGALLQVMRVKEPVEIPYALMYVVLLVINLIALAWSSNEVIIQSMNVGEAVYESNWMDQNEEVKKLLLITLLRSQKPLSIDVGPFRPMNTGAALLTMKGSYTYAQVMTHTRS